MKESHLFQPPSADWAPGTLQKLSNCWIKEEVMNLETPNTEPKEQPGVIRDLMKEVEKDYM